MRRRGWWGSFPVATGAGVFVAAGLWSGPLRHHFVIVPVALVASITAGVAWVDAHTRRIPNVGLIAASVVLFAGALAVTAIDHRPGTSADAGIGLALYAVPLLLVNLRSPTGLGAGDVKLGVVLGGTAGLVHPLAAPFALALGCVLALATRAAIRPTTAMTHAGEPPAQPFAPSLVAAWCAMVVAVPGVIRALGVAWHYRR